MWTALVAGLSPIVAQLAAHASQHWWVWPCAVFWPLFGIAIAREPVQRTQRGVLLGRIGLVFALLLFVGSYAGGIPSAARLALPLAAAGLALFLGHPMRGALLLTPWLIPPPSAIVSLASPTLERGYASLASLAPGLSRDFTTEASLLRKGSEALALEAADGGVMLAYLLTGLALFTALWRRSEPRWTRIAAAGGLAFALQGAAVLCAALLLATFGSEAADTWLHQLWLPAATLATLALGLLRRPSGRTPER